MEAAKVGPIYLLRGCDVINNVCKTLTWRARLRIAFPRREIQCGTSHQTDSTLSIECIAQFSSSQNGKRLSNSIYGTAKGDFA